MSYSSRPNTNKYGDSDFVQDDWSQQQTAPQPPLAQPINYQGSSVQQNANAPLGPGQVQPPTMTMEDVVFVRTWQRDAFLTRVLPIDIALTGFQYYINVKRGLPHSIARYIFISVASIPIGFLTYSGEFKRRIRDSQSTTPFMQNLKRMTRVPPTPTSGFVTESMPYSGSQPSGFVSEPEPFVGTQPTGFVSEQTGFVNDQGGLVNEQRSPRVRQGELADWNAHNAPISDGSKTATTYDELRAKNRGYSR